MARRSQIFKEEQPQVEKRDFFVKIQNLTEKTFLVPVIAASGEMENLSIRVQGRNGQKPPVINKKFITPRLLELQRRKLIKIVDVE